MLGRRIVPDLFVSIYYKVYPSLGLIVYITYMNQNKFVKAHIRVLHYKHVSLLIVDTFFVYASTCLDCLSFHNALKYTVTTQW